MPDASARKARLWLFIGKFSLTIVLLLMVWWGFLMLRYAWLLGHISAFLVGLFSDMEITGILLEPKGLFNTDTLLDFTVAGKVRAFPVALLVTNIPPFIALVLATSGLDLVRRLRAIGIGVGILLLSHVFFISVLLRFQDTLQAHDEVSRAVMQVIIATLPFILWIRLAYWDRIASLLREGIEEANKR
jgi:hypothetical protein